MPTSLDVEREAFTWEGVKWRHQGRTRSAVDCVGLVAKTAHALGLSDYDFTTYQRFPNGEFLSHFTNNMDRVSFQEIRRGDVVVLRDSVYPCHCGILVMRRGSLHLEHAHASRKKVVVEPFTGDLYSRRVAAFRFRGLED